MAIENEAGFMSLADLAAMNTDEVQVLMSRLPEKGMYLVLGEEVTASESRDESDSTKPPLFAFTFKAKILGAELLDKEKDPESLVGRTLNDRFTLWPSDFTECIGLLKGRYKTVGLPYEGAMGGVEGQDPGWLDAVVGHKFMIRVRHYSTKNGERAGFDWKAIESDEVEDETEAA